MGHCDDWVNMGLCGIAIFNEGFFLPSFSFLLSSRLFVVLFLHATAIIHRYPCGLDSLHSTRSVSCSPLPSLYRDSRDDFLWPVIYRVCLEEFKVF